MPGQDFILYFWSNLLPLIPQSLQHGNTSEQFFETTLAVFRAIDDSGRESLNLTLYTQEWSNLLLRHKHEEVCPQAINT